MTKKQEARYEELKSLILDQKARQKTLILHSQCMEDVTKGIRLQSDYANSILWIYSKEIMEAIEAREKENKNELAALTAEFMELRKIYS